MGLLSHPNKLKRAVMELRSRRIDFAHVGDSNALQNGNGWHWGLIYALATRLGTSSNYASAAIDFAGGSSNWGGADQSSFSFAPFATGTHNIATSGAPAYQGARMTTAANDHPPRYAYMADNAAIDTTYGASLFYANLISSGHYCNPASTACRWHLSYSTFPAATSGANQFRLAAFTNGGTLLTLGSEINPGGPGDGTAFASIDYTTPATSAERRLFPTRWQGGTADERTIGGPVALYWSRVEVPARTSGWSTHVLIAMGGKSFRDHAIGLGATDSETSRTGQNIEQLKHHIQSIVRLQAGAPILVVRCCSGFNDLHPTGGAYLSVGGAGLATSSSGGFFDNLKAIRTRIMLAWTSLGYDPRGLYFIVARSHSADSYDTRLRRLHTAASDFAATYENCSAYDTGAVATQAQIVARSWGAGDEHLTKAGYEQHSLREVDALLTEPFRLGAGRSRMALVR